MDGKTLKMKFASIALILAMVIAGLGFATMNSSAVYADADNEITVYVTISNKGEVAVAEDGTIMANVPVTVAADENNLATMDTVLKAAHDEYCPGGYMTEESAWGTSVVKVWNVENNYGYKFVLNNALCQSGVGSEYVTEGDYIVASVMTDTTYWTDSHAYFDKDAATVKVGEEVALNLAYINVEYDANWNATYTYPALAGATVKVVGGEEALAVTDEEGNAVVSFDEAGTYVVTAVTPENGPVINAPVCVVTVEAEEEVVPPADDVVVTPEVDEAEPTDEPVVEEEPADTDEPAADNQEAAEAETVVETEADVETAPATGDEAQTAVYLFALMAAGGALMAVRKRAK